MRSLSLYFGLRKASVQVILILNTEIAQAQRKFVKEMLDFFLPFSHVEISPSLNRMWYFGMVGGNKTF